MRSLAVVSGMLLAMVMAVAALAQQDAAVYITAATVASEGWQSLLMMCSAVCRSLLIHAGRRGGARMPPRRTRQLEPSAGQTRCRE